MWKMDTYLILTIVTDANFWITMAHIQVNPSNKKYPYEEAKN